MGTVGGVNLMSLVKFMLLEKRVVRDGEYGKRRSTCGLWPVGMAGGSRRIHKRVNGENGMIVSRGIT
jgi:hypothetical protein